MGLYGTIKNKVKDTYNDVKDAVSGTDAEKVDLNRNDTQLLHGDSLRDKANTGYFEAGDRDAPTAAKTILGDVTTSAGATTGSATQTANTQLGSTAQAANTILGSTTNANTTQLGAVTDAATAQLGSASHAGNTQLGNAAQVNQVAIDQAQQDQWRQQQMDLAGQLNNQAKGIGPSVAGMQFDAATDRNLAQQQALAAGARGGNAAMASRQAARNASDFNQSAAQQAAIARIQEQRSGQEMLGNLASQGRASDIGLATSQANLGQQANLSNQDAYNSFAMQQGQMDQNIQLANSSADNQFALTQGQMQQSSNLTNAEAANQFSLSQGQMDQNVNLTNAAASNQANLQQGQMDLSTSLSNTSALNQSNLQQGQMDQNTALSNTAATNQFALTQAQLDQNNSQFNADAYNTSTLQQGQFDQSTNLADLQAQLTQTGMNDAAQLAYLSQLTGMDQAELTARMQQDALAVQQRDAGSGGLLGDVVGAAGTLGAAYVTAGSDRKLKKKIKKPDMDDFLEKYGAPSQDEIKALSEIGSKQEKAGQMISEGTKNSGNSFIKAAGAIGGAYLAKKGTDKRKNEEKTRREFAGNMSKLKNEATHVENVKIPGWKKKLEDSEEDLIALSDEKKKTDVKSGDTRLDDFLSKIQAYEYEYKDPEKFGEGRRISPMAQDLEKSELGKEMVIDTPEGKMVDYGKGLGTIVASLAHLNEELDKLKKDRK